MAFSLFSEILSAGEAVGLSLGRGAARAVMLAKSDKGFELIDSVSVEFPAGREPHSAEMEAALAEVAGLVLKERPRLVANVEAHLSRLYFFDLPFDRANKIRQALPYIIEPLTMTRVEELFFDYLPLTESTRKGAPAVAVAAEPEEVSSVVNRLQAAGLNAETVLPDSLGLIEAGRYFFEDQSFSQPFLFLDLGAGQTSMVLFDQGRASIARTVPFGGLHLTRALAEAKKIDISEAEAIKRKINLGENDLSGDGAILAEAWKVLIAEIERTLAAAPASPPEPKPVLALAGGGAHTPGLTRFLKNQLGFEARLLNDETPGASRLPGLKPELVPAAGLAMLGLVSRPRPNLRQGELAPQQALVRYRKSLILMAAGLCLAALLSILTLALDYRHQKIRYNEVKAEITRVFKEASPETTRIVSPLAQLRQKVEEARSGVSGLASSRRRVLDLILEVSRVAKARPGLRLLDLSLTPQTLELQWEGGSFEDIDRLKNDLGGLPFFSEVSVGGARVDPVTRKLTFKLTLKRRLE